MVCLSFSILINESELALGFVNRGPCLLLNRTQTHQSAKNPVSLQSSNAIDSSHTQKVYLTFCCIKLDICFEICGDFPIHKEPPLMT